MQRDQHRSLPLEHYDPEDQRPKYWLDCHPLSHSLSRDGREGETFLGQGESNDGPS